MRDVISPKNGALIPKKLCSGLLRSSCIDRRTVSFCTHVISGRATNSGEQCCWLSKGQSKFEGESFKPRRALDGSEVLNWLFFNGQKWVSTARIYHKSTYKSNTSSDPLSS